MRQLYLLAVAAVICANGCQTGDTVHRADSLGERFDQDESYAATAIDSSHHDATASGASVNAREFKRLPDPNASIIQPVAYEQERSETPAIRPAEEIPIPLPSADSVLTLEQLEQMALGANPAVATAGARVQALRGKWLQVGLAPNPTIGYVGGEIGNDGAAGQQGGFVGQQFITGGKLGLNRAVVEQEILKAEQDWAAIQQRVLTDVRIGYYDVLISQRRMDLTRDLVGVSEQAVEASKALLKAKEVSEVGVLQTEVEAQTAQILARRARNENEAAWRRLSSVLGRPDLAPQRLAGELREAESSLNWDEQLQRLVTESPEAAAAVAELQRARWALDRAYAQVKPDVNVQVAVQYDNATGDTISGVQVGLPIPLWNKNQGGIQQAQSEIAAAERDIERVELGLRRRLATAFQTYQDASFQVTKYSNDILPKAQQTFDLVSRGYKAGEVGYLDMLTAQRTYFQTNLAYVESLRELWRSRLRIDGLLLDGSLDEQPSRQTE